jgi:hypothetical protein
MLTTLDLPLTGENEVGFSLLQNELTQEQPNYFALFETEASSFMDTDLGTIAMRSSNETDVDQAANRDSEIGITNDSRQLAIAGPSKIKRASRKTKNQKQYTELMKKITLHLVNNWSDADFTTKANNQENEKPKFHTFADLHDYAVAMNLHITRNTGTVLAMNQIKKSILHEMEKFHKTNTSTVQSTMHHSRGTVANSFYYVCSLILK